MLFRGADAWSRYCITPASEQASQLGALQGSTTPQALVHRLLAQPGLWRLKPPLEQLKPPAKVLVPYLPFIAKKRGPRRSVEPATQRPHAASLVSTRFEIRTDPNRASDSATMRFAHRARQEPAIQREKFANSGAPAHVHSSHAAHKAAGAAACIPTTRPHRAGPCGLRCALPSCSPTE